MKTEDIYKGFDALIKEICNHSDEIDYDLEFVQDAIGKLPEYFNVVVTSEMSIKMAYIRYEDDVESLHNTVENIDKMRREKHISLTNSINQLNRLCNSYQIPPIFNTGRNKDLNPELKEDREIAVDMCYTFCRDVFLDAKARNVLVEQENIAQHPTSKERDAELYAIGKDQLGTFHHEIMKSVNITETKSGSTLQSLIEKAGATKGLIKTRGENNHEFTQTR